MSARALATLAALGALLACGSPTRSLEGTWTGRDDAGNGMTFVFRDDGRGDWIVQIPDGMPPETLSMRWSTDPRSEPARIDLWDFEEGPLRGMKMAGIYEWTGDHAFRVDFEPVRPGEEADSVRPKAFTDDTVVFTREGAGP